MNNPAAIIPYSTGEILNGYKSVEYPGGLKYSGMWEKGRKVGEGYLEYQSLKIKVKIKQGHIYKCIEIVESNLNYNKISHFNLPDIKFKQVGDNYKEEISKTFEFFFVIRGRNILFDGKPCNFLIINVILEENLTIYFGKTSDQKNKTFTIMDLEIDNIKIIGHNMNSSPNGLTKIFLNDLKYKGIMKGLFFKGLFVVKNEIFKASLEANFIGIKDTVKVSSKVLNFQVTIIRSNSKILFQENGSLNIDTAKSFSEEIISYIGICIFGLTKILHALIQNSLSTMLISYSLAVNENWRLFEQNVINKNERKRNLPNNYAKSNNSDIKCLMVFENKERFEGKVVNGKFEGFGKYFYDDGSVYVGEFKKNLRDGLGSFKFKDGRMYKGYWVKNFMHGKGCMINGSERICGIWERNKIAKGCVYAANRLD